MSDLQFQEQAQLGLKYIEDAVVDLLTRHPRGLSGQDIGVSLGLGVELEPALRERLVGAILELLVGSGRILRGAEADLFMDNPARS
jgi:hypothetical protein